MTEPPDFSRLGDVLEELLGSSGHPLAHSVRALSPGGSHAPHTGALHTVDGVTGDLAKVLAAVWPEVVGGEVAANARPLQLRNGRLVVSASSSAWAQTLQLMGDAIAGRLNERLGEGAVKTVIFRHAGWEEPQSGPQSRPDSTDRNNRNRTGGGRERRISSRLSGPIEEDAGTPGEASVDTGRRVDVAGTTTGSEALAAQQRAALAELDTLQLPPALRDKIRRALEAVFIRAQQDFVRSERT